MAPYADIFVYVDPGAVGGRIALVLMISMPAKCVIVICFDGGDHDEAPCDEDTVKLIAVVLMMMRMRL